jgi:hypothetical protein
MLMVIVPYGAQSTMVEVDFWMYRKVFDCGSHKSRSDDDNIDVQTKMNCSSAMYPVEGVCAQMAMKVRLQRVSERLDFCIEERVQEVLMVM